MKVVLAYRNFPVCRTCQLGPAVLELVSKLMNERASYSIVLRTLRAFKYATRSQMKPVMTGDFMPERPPNSVESSGRSHVLSRMS